MYIYVDIIWGELWIVVFLGDLNFHVDRIIYFEFAIDIK